MGLPVAGEVGVRCACVDEKKPPGWTGGFQDVVWLAYDLATPAPVEGEK
jgi:hypothetical protein